MILIRQNILYEQMNNKNNEINLVSYFKQK